MQKVTDFPPLDDRWQLNYRILDEDCLNHRLSKVLNSGVTGGGVQFASRTAAAAGSMIAMEMIPDCPGMDIIALARVCWCRFHEGSSTHTVGVEFLWAGWRDGATQKSIADYLKEQIAGCDGHACVVEQADKPQRSRWFLGILALLALLAAFLISCLLD